jgi:regulator of sigma E protease
MTLLTGIWDFVIPFLIILTVLVFVHEMGHYLIAKRCGVRIEVFSIGFGPELFGWTDRSGTRWKFSLIPLGGYVKMFGDADATSRPAPGVQEPPPGEGTGDWAEGTTRPLTPEEKAVSFHHKRLGQRSWVVAGGPLANFLFALVVLTGFFTFYGQPTTPPVVGEVLADSAADVAGIEAGDRFVRINGTRIERFEEIQRLVQLNLDAPLEVELARGSESLALTVSPVIIEATDNLGRPFQMARLGVAASGTEYIRFGPLESAWRAVEETVSLTEATLKAVSQIVLGTRSADELGGPIRIAELSGQVAEAGFVSVVWFMAVLSINLGLINIFPIPMLDGGHLLFYAIEAVRGRPLGERAQEYGFRIGLAMVVSLILFVTWNDLVRLRFIDFLTGLVT